MLEKSTLYKDELENLQNLLHFPEVVALQLTEVEYGLFYNVMPIHYIRQVTLHLGPDTVCDNTVKRLVKRFQEVCAYYTCKLKHYYIQSNSVGNIFCGLNMVIQEPLLLCYHILFISSSTENVI